MSKSDQPEKSPGFGIEGKFPAPEPAKKKGKK